MLLLGCDPEYILTRNGIPFSSIGIIGGNKDFPLEVREGALQEDNVLAEINIAPSANVDTWNRRIVSVTQQLKRKLPKGVIISKLSVALFPEEAMIHPLAQRFGCEPDMNAWTGQVNPAPTPPVPNFRSAGGHIHVGRENMSMAEAMDIVRCLDTVIGLQSLFLDEGKERRKLYGRAGCMRKKPYGLEWRTLSNFWVFTAYDRRWAYNAVRWCVDNRANIVPHASQDVEAIINEEREREAFLYLKSLKKQLRFPMHREVM